jgi:DNA-binding response OmpR family regulator
VQGDVVPYLRYLTESFQSFANGQNLSLQFFTTLDKLEMDYDPEQLSQVMTNLISNALKFTPSGGEVCVTIGKLETGKLEISVADTGIGISEAELPHIFDRFYQVDGSHTREGEGTGIGLAHTFELVKLMGGDISAESPEYSGGKGTVFRVVLPITNKEKRETGNKAFTIAPVEAPAQIADPEIEDAQLPTLLIIEDNPDVVTYLKTCLRGLYRLDVAFNGRIGIERAVETVPDLIISDVMMPEKDGYQVCDTLKKDERTSHIPVILLTAKADAASRISGLRTGADAYLSKPFDKEELLVRLEKLAELRRRMQERYSNWNLSAPPPGQAPDQEPAGQEPVSDLEDAFLQKVRMEVENELGNAELNPAQLGRALGLSKSQFYRKMNALTGKAPAIFVRTVRLHRAMELLRSTDMNISEIAYEVGFSDPAYFSRTFSEEFGSAPNENRGRP